MALGRYAYGRRCKLVRIKGRGTRCHCNGRFVSKASCAGKKSVSKKSTDRRNRRRRSR